jgi:tetratricopeptide (TPR) repeat protein
LPPQAQDTLCLAAVVGREFQFDTLAQASELGEEALVDALERAERAQLIEELSSEAGGTFSFTHGLIPATLAEGLSGLRRRRLHRRVAEVIEALHPEDGSWLAALAHHYSQADVEDKALRYLTGAGDRARASYANKDAIRYYSQALEYVPEGSPQRLDLLAARAGVYGLMAEWGAQRADLEAMLALAEALGDEARRCDALVVLAECLWGRTGVAGCREPAERAAEAALKIGDLVREGRALRFLGFFDTMVGYWARSRSMLEAALARFQEAGRPSESAACLSRLSLALYRLGEPAAALGAAAQAVALSREAGDRRQEAISLRHLAYAYSNQGQHAAALPAVEAALALHREMGDRNEECHALNGLGMMLGELGKLEEAAGAFQQMLEIAEEIGSASGIAWGVSNMVLYALAPQGEYEAALALLQTWLTRARQAKDAELTSHCQWHKAYLLFVLGQVKPALELAQSVLPDADGLPAYGDQSWVLQIIGCCQAELGRFHQARESFQAGLEKAEQAGEPVNAGLFWLHLASAAYLEGDQARLRAAMEQVQQRDFVLPPRYVFFHRDVARLHLALGAVEQALESSSKVMQEIETFGEEYFVEQYYLTHARVLRALGRDAEADGFLRRAYERVMLVASKTHDEVLRQSWLENVRDNREILAEWEARGKRA